MRQTSVKNAQCLENDADLLLFLLCHTTTQQQQLCQSVSADFDHTHAQHDDVTTTQEDKKSIVLVQLIKLSCYNQSLKTKGLIVINHGTAQTQ